MQLHKRMPTDLAVGVCAERGQQLSAAVLFAFLELILQP